MQDVNIDRLCRKPGGLILHCMKKALSQAPTAEELYALERRARQERARYLAGLLRTLYDQAISGRAFSASTTAKVVRHA
jgi:hypothetical protein